MSDQDRDRTSNEAPARQSSISHLTKALIMAALGLMAIFAGGCLTESAAGTGSMSTPLLLLDRNGGATHIVIYPESTEDLGGGSLRYSGSAFAQIEANPSAGRETDGIQGNAIAVVNESAGQRQFTFTSTESTDLGWSGVDAAQVSIEGSGPPSEGSALLSASAMLNSDRSSNWGFTTSDVGVSANLASQSPIFTVSAETGSAGNPYAVVQAPNPGGLTLAAQGMGLIFAQAPGETPLGPVATGQWVKFTLPGSTPLSQGVTLSWNPGANSLIGSGQAGRLDIPSASVDAFVEVTATQDEAYLSFSGPMDPPQLGILSDGSGTFWTNSECTDCADIRFSGPGMSIDTINIPSLVGTQEIRGGNPTSSRITASGVNGSVGPVVIDNGDLVADFSDPSNITADLAVTGRVLGMPVMTTFHGPFSFDLAQMGVNLTGALYLNLADKVVLDGTLSAAISAAGADVTYSGGVALPTYGASFDVLGALNYDLTQQQLGLNLDATGSIGPVSVQGVDLDLDLTPANGGMDIDGSLGVGAISAGNTSLTNVQIGISGNTAGSVTAAINDSSNRAHLRVGNLAQVDAHGSLTYNVPANALAFGLNFGGRVSSWQIANGAITINWPGSGDVVGAITVGQVSNGQVTIANAVLDFTASSTGVSANLRPTTITAGSLVSATVSGTATYNVSTSTTNLTLTAAGRVGSINVNGVTAAITWPMSGNITGSVNIGNVTYGSASLNNTTIGFTANSSSVNATIGSTLNIGDPFRLNIGLSGSASYNVANNTLGVAITTGTGTMWNKAISGSVGFNVTIASNSISGSANTSSLRFSYDKFGISLTNTSLNFSVSGSTVSVSGSGSVSVNGPMGNGWLAGSGSFTVTGNVLRSTNYRITMNNMNKTITWVDVGPRNGAPLSVDILAGSLSYDAEGKMRARVDTGFPLYCEDLEFKIHAWGDQNVLRVDFDGSWVIGLFGARGHMDVYDWLSNTNPPMYGYADARITFVWFRFQTWNGQSLENGGC